MAGGSAAQYQEVEGTEREKGARGRWTMPADAQSDAFPMWLAESSRRDVANASGGDNVAVAVHDPVTSVPSSARLTRDREPSFASVAKPVVQAPVAPTIVKQSAPAPLSSVFARLVQPDGSGTDGR